jgi:iron(III) transport system ATP-binding protein
MTILTVDGIRLGYGRTVVVSDFDMVVPEGGLVCLLGPSGCGKTTVLRAIAGFTPIDRGRIRLRGDVVSAPGVTVAPEKRGIGMVFQDYALFPHLSVGANIGFGLRRRSRSEVAAAVSELLDVVGLAGYASRYPHELSGGEQQRVALARALAPRPDLVLLDEPFSNLDIELRERLSTEVADILRRRRTAAILVTHDQHEAFALGELVGVMRDGKVMQWDTPYNLYHEPKTRFVADFIGQGVFVRGSWVGEESVETELGVLRGRRAIESPIGATVDVLLRPDDIIADDDGPISGMVAQKAFKGAETMYSLVLPTGQTVLSLLPSHVDLAVGEHVRVRVAAEHLVAFPVEDER